jgi:hypothetical protein
MRTVSVVPVGFAQHHGLTAVNLAALNAPDTDAARCKSSYSKLEKRILQRSVLVAFRRGDMFNNRVKQRRISSPGRFGSAEE